MSYSHLVFQGPYFTRDLQNVLSDPCSQCRAIRFKDPVFLRSYIPYNRLFPGPYGMRTLCSQGSIFCRVLYSQGPMIPVSYVLNILDSQCSIFSGSFIPRVLYSHGPIFSESFIPRVLYSDGPIFPGYYILTVLHSSGSYFLMVQCSQGLIYTGSSIPRLLYSHGPIYSESCMMIFSYFPVSWGFFTASNISKFVFETQIHSLRVFLRK